MKTKILVEIDFEHEPKKLREIVYHIEKSAFDRALSFGNKVSNTTANLHIGHDVIVRDKLIQQGEI